MTTSEPGEVRNRRRGRPRIHRAIEGSEPLRCYVPQCSPHQQGETVRILPEELEILRLVDLDGMEQEAAATMLGVSRKTAWRDLHEARRKIADALVHGKRIDVAGCSRRNTESCPKYDDYHCPYEDTDSCPRKHRMVSEDED
ncbi:MAG TPA: DUF134 domain-containing protein [Methanomicrobiales archaeon]|nr:DUF134 domain-containing protein [Methanomicrobiales archaeon]